MTGAGRGAAIGPLRFGLGRGGREIYVSHIDISWVQCYKTIHRDEILDRSTRGRYVASGRNSSQTFGGDGRGIYLPLNCRAAFRQTYWTSAVCKSMSSGPVRW